MVNSVEFGFPKFRQNHQEKMVALLAKIEGKRLVESASQQPSLRPGTVFADRFIVGPCLYGPSPEKMTQSEVYVAQDKEQGHSFVALKVSPIPSPYCISALDDPFAPGFENEAKILSRLSLPAFPRFVAAGCVSDWQLSTNYGLLGIAYRGPRHYIAMEQLVGIELAALIKNGLPFWQTLDIMMQLLHCTAAEHNAGLVDRDLKPQNVIVQPDGLVRRYDFALALESQKTLSSTGFHGTYAYAAPEQILGAEIGKNIDLYALGLIFLEMLTGHHPFMESSKASIIEVVRLQRERKIPTLTKHDLKGLDNPLDNPDVEIINHLLAKMTEKDPSCRYQTAEEVLQDLSSRTPVKLRRGESWLDKVLSFFGRGVRDKSC
jgi:serine/threonine protein kinase